MPWRCQAESRLCWEGSKPSGVAYGVKSSDTNRHQGGSCAPIHTYLHVTFKVRQQWLRGASPSFCDNHAILFFSNQPHHSCIQWEPCFFLPWIPHNQEPQKWSWHCMSWSIFLAVKNETTEWYHFFWLLGFYPTNSNNGINLAGGTGFSITTSTTASNQFCENTAHFPVKI